MCVVCVEALKDALNMTQKYIAANVVGIFFMILDTISDISILRPTLLTLETASTTSVGAQQLFYSRYKSICQFLKTACISEHSIALRILYNIYNSATMISVEASEVADLITYLKQPKLTTVHNFIILCVIMLSGCHQRSHQNSAYTCSTQSKTSHISEYDFKEIE